MEVVVVVNGGAVVVGVVEVEEKEISEVGEGVGGDLKVDVLLIMDGEGEGEAFV